MRGNIVNILYGDTWNQGGEERNLLMTHKKEIGNPEWT